MHTVASAAEAREARDKGIDLCTAQGWEAGGHVWEETATLPLVPCVVDAVAPLPVLAAGGIADGRGIAAALALGAAGVWLGTRFLATTEARVHPIYQEKILHATETDTVYSSLFDGGWPDAPHRTLRNNTVNRWEASGSPPRGKRPGEGEMVATTPNGQPVQRYSGVIPLQRMTGNLEDLALYAGQSVGLIADVRSASEVMNALANETVLAL